MAALFDSPFRRLHRESARFERLSIARARHVHRPMLFGRRAVAAPGMALAVRKELGVNRHVLNQMVVAGTVKFMPAFPPPSRRSEAPASAAPAPVAPAAPPPTPAAASGDFPPGVIPTTGRTGTRSPTSIPTSSNSEE